MCVVAVTLKAFLKHWNLSIIPMTGGCSFDSSKASLKTVLLNNGNEKPSIPLVHATASKQTHELMELNSVLNKLLCFQVEYLW